jgi:hypothetical protein
VWSRWFTKRVAPRWRPPAPPSLLPPEGDRRACGLSYSPRLQTMSLSNPGDPRERYSHSVSLGNGRGALSRPVRVPQPRQPCRAPARLLDAAKPWRFPPSPKSVAPSLPHMSRTTTPGGEATSVREKRQVLRTRRPTGLDETTVSSPIPPTVVCKTDNESSGAPLNSAGSLSPALSYFPHFRDRSGRRSVVMEREGR